MKPIMNLAEVEFDEVEENAIYTSSRGQILDTGTTTLRYLAPSTIIDVEACEYPDSQKVLIVTGNGGERRLREMFRAENTVDYYDRESNEEPPR